MADIFRMKQLAGILNESQDAAAEIQQSITSAKSVKGSIAKSGKLSSGISEADLYAFAKGSKQPVVVFDCEQLNTDPRYFTGDSFSDNGTMKYQPSEFLKTLDKEVAKLKKSGSPVFIFINDKRLSAKAKNAIRVGLMDGKFGSTEVKDSIFLFQE